MENLETKPNINSEEVKYNAWSDASDAFEIIADKWNDFLEKIAGHEKENEEELKKFKSQLDQAHTEENRTYNE